MADDVLLLVAREPQRKPVVYDLLLERYVVGREQDCDIVVDSSPEISRKHMELQFREGRYWAVPQGKGGVWCKGKPVLEARKLSHGDTLLLPGEVRLQVLVCGAAERGKVVERIVSEDSGAKRRVTPKIGKAMIAYFGVLAVLFVALLASGDRRDEQENEERLYLPAPEEGGKPVGVGQVKEPLSERLLHPRGGDIARSVLGIPDQEPVRWATPRDRPGRPEAERDRKPATEADVERMIALAKARREREARSPDSSWRYLEQLVDFCGFVFSDLASRQKDWNLQAFRDAAPGKDMGVARRHLLTEIDAVEKEIKKAVDEQFRLGDRLRAMQAYRDALKAYAQIPRMIPDPEHPAAKEAARVAAVCRSRLED